MSVLTELNGFVGKIDPGGFVPDFVEIRIFGIHA
jgi:hypothetical protein